MSVAEFFNYNISCPVCNGALRKKAEVDIYLEQANDANSFSYAGVIIYDYNKKFSKNTSEMWPERGLADIMAIIQEKLPKTFIIDKRFSMRTNKNAISDIIAPWFINATGVRLHSECESKNHLYYYASDFIHEGDASNNVELLYEQLRIYDLSIENSFENKIQLSTHIFKDKPLDDRSLPAIPIRKWNFTSSAAIEEQMNKYLLLK